MGVLWLLLCVCPVCSRTLAVGACARAVFATAVSIMFAAALLVFIFWELMGLMKGIRIGSAVDGSVHAFIEDMEPLTDPHSGAEGVGVDADGNVYGAVVRRRMLERHVLQQ